MAKKFYDEDITLSTDWGGDASTGNLPVSGNKVQKVIKESINSKVGYVGRVEKSGQGFYVLTRDEDIFNKYVETISDENPFGDLTMDGVNGRFDAPFNYKMNITLINPESGYKSTLLGSTGNVIKFRAETLDNNDTPQGESMTITFKVKTEGGVETTFTSIYDGKTASQGIEYNLDGKLGSGVNTVTITAVGMNTGISAMRRITYRLIDMYFKDKFEINKRYQFTSEGTLALNVGYDLKGVGKTKILWYFDGNQYAVDEISNENPNLSNQSKTFHFTENTDKWLTAGIHTLQMSMVSRDTDSGEEFQTPIYYREFVVEKTPTVLETPYIVRKTSFDFEKGFLVKGENPVIYNCKQYENVTVQYAAYYNGKSDCDVTTFVKYATSDLIEVTSEKLPLVSDDFSEIQNQVINLTQEGGAEVIIRAYYGDNEYFETNTSLDINPSDMNISTVEDNVVLYLNAFGRSNNSADKESWEYKYLDEYGREQIIKTYFSKNEYVVASTLDMEENVIAPSDANETNSLVVNELPIDKNEEYKYLIFNNEYYIWNKEFDWSDTSGWSDNKLKLANGNAITIDYTPFSSNKLTSLKQQGATFEFEFETTNVYNDDAVICRICGNDNFAPGISIYASGAELVISRAVESDGENAGYTKAVSTKYKAEESNRITFVITPDSNDPEYRNRILSIYVNGEYCGAHDYAQGTNFGNDSKITFRGSEDACVNIYSIKMYSRALNSNEILNNYIYYRNDTDEKAEIYKRNDIMLASNDEAFDSDKLKSQLPVMMIYQISENESLDDIHQEKKNKKLPRRFDISYIDIQNPSKNFVVKKAYVTPQGTSSMNYPVKNLRLYTAKKDDTRLYVGSNIFLDGSTTNLNDDNLNPDCLVSKRKYAFRDNAIPVKCWCLKADFAESSSSHNTGTSRYWNEVLKNAGYKTKAQSKAEKYKDEYPYDVRTAIDGFPIVVFYQSLDGSSPRFEGKYNFNNDKSTEDVFGFTGGIELDDQEVKYYYIGKEKPVIQSEENDDGEIEYTCSWEEGAYTETPTTDSPLYTSDNKGNWYMLRGKELLDNPKMECWELLNSVNEIALFKTMKGFGIGDGNEKVGIVDGENFDGAFESRYPDCGEYFHINSLKRFGEWLVSCRYLDIDSETGKSIPFSTSSLPMENYHKNEEGKLSICSLTKQKGNFTFDFPGKNFYTEVDYELIASNIKLEGYQQVSLSNDIIAEIEYEVFETLPTEKIENVEYIKVGDLFYTWMPSNLLITDILPSVHETSYDYVQVGDKYYEWLNVYNFEDFHETQWVDDTTFNRALKFSVEKYDHIEMNKMAAYYIYLMRFGGVDQTVKNSMLTTEGPGTDDANSTLPSLWYFINYDNDTILGVKNDGRLVFDPYITRETKDGTGYVYAGRESTLWNNLEADVEFMAKVTEVDNKLADGGANSMYALSYANALREYDVNQSDKWCERIYNKDAERKYIQTFVEGWTQKIEADNTETHVYENYLYDVQGSRSAHRKWWLGRRFNVFDSRFCNANFRNQLIKFRSTNLPAGSSFTLKSGEPIFYAWGHDNAVTEMTPTAIQPGDNYTFVTKSAFNIGSYLELMGAANISTLDLRNCVGALTELDVTGCYSPSVGTKMKEILVGDHTRTDLINESNTSMKFSGLKNASKLEVIDITNIKNITALDGLESLLNINKVYAKGTSISNFTFADGAMIEYVELPSTTETLSLTRSSSIGYDNINFESNNLSKLNNLTIDNCSKLMNDPTFVLNWVGSKTVNQRKNMNLNLQGINWKFNINNYSNLFLLENVGTADNAQRNIRGTIEITSNLDISDVIRLKNIFGDECFKEGSKVYVKAPTGLYIDIPSTIWEGQSNIKSEITTVGTTLSGNLMVSAIVNEIIDGKKEQKVIESTNGIITMDTTNLNKGYVLLNILESDNVYENLVVTVTYQDETGFEMMQPAGAMINKRIYPENIQVTSVKDSYNNNTKNALSINYSPEAINDLNLEGRGVFTVLWEMVEGTGDYYNKVVLHDTNKEIAYIQAPNGFDGIVKVKATVTRTYDNQILASAEKEIEFTNPYTIITKYSNEPIYNILVANGIIVETDGFGMLDKTKAATLTMKDLVDGNGNSIFAGHTEIVSFLEFQYFNNTYMGQMPQTGIEAVVTPNGMFKGCTGLKEIAFSNNFKYTGENSMFEGCTNLEYIYGPKVSEDENGNPEYTNLSFAHICDNFAKGCTKLKTCLLSSTAKYIGNQAFMNCKLLEYFQLPSAPDAVIYYSNSTSAFQECENINFYGAEYGSVSEAKYQVHDNACYEVLGDGSIRLIHLGKNTLISNMPKDVNIITTAYSMEYRKREHEPNVVVPKNVILEGQRIFNNSIGESMTLLCCVIKPMETTHLFSNTTYNGNYTFAKEEKYIPSHCFYGTELKPYFVVPEGIERIYGNSFYNTSNMYEVVLPSTLLEIESNTFWLSSGLKVLTFNGPQPPVIQENDFFNVTFEKINVLPQYYDVYKENIMRLLKPFVEPIKLHKEGYIRIIKDGVILSINDIDKLTVGGIEVFAEMENDYMKYTTNSDILDTNIYLNDEVIGKVGGKYTTIYLGNNTSLFKGEGYNFSKGVYDEVIKEEMIKNGWSYDARFEGIRSGELTNDKTEMSFNIPSFLNKMTSIKYGAYYQQSGERVHTYFSDENGILLKSINLGYSNIANITPSSEKINIGFDKAGYSISTGLNGIVINEIGESIYSDPELSGDNTKEITVNMISPVEVPNNVYVTVTDNMSHTYRKYWNGTSLKFVIPTNYNFIVTAEDFVFNDKTYYLTETVNVTEDEVIINLTFEGKNGIELKNGILCYYTNDTDWYINLTKFNNTWGNNTININAVNVEEILSSDANGFENTQLIAKEDNASIFNKALNDNSFEENMIGYIPSYIEIMLLSSHIDEINNYLSERHESINLNNIWVSESYDTENAWTSDGVKMSKNINLDYYVFGKKINA